MKSLAQLILIGIATVTAPVSTCYAQCSQLQTTLVRCGGPNNCVQSVPINIPSPSQYGFYLGHFDVYCCSTIVQSYTEDSGCEGTHQYAPIPKKPLAEAASLQPLLIRNCAGGYDPYMEERGSDFNVMQSLNSLQKVNFN